MKNLSKSKCLNSQIVIAALVVALAVFGCVMVYSASFYSAQHHYGNQYFFLFKQIMGAVIGIAGMIFFAFLIIIALQNLNGGL